MFIQLKIHDFVICFSKHLFTKLCASFEAMVSFDQLIGRHNVTVGWVCSAAVTQIN